MAIYNWYHGTPVDSSPAPDTPDPEPPIVEPVGPVDVKLDENEGRRNPDIHKFSKGVVQKDGSYKRDFTVVDDLSSVKYDSLASYLKAENLGDRSGFFSGVNFDVPFDSTKARGTEMIAGMAGPAGLLGFGPVLSNMDTQRVADPSGTGDRFIPTSGFGNLMASMVIDEEYRELYKIKKFRNDAANIGKDGGFVMRVGGKNIWRRPGQSMYRGQLDQMGLDQQTVAKLEEYDKGVKNGMKVANALLGGGEVNDEMIESIGDGRVVLETTNGGYLLNGNFHFGTGISAMGYMEDMDNLAMSMFSANGQLTLGQAKTFAQSWRSSAKSMGRNASAADLIKNLQTFQTQASNYAASLRGDAQTFTSASAAKAAGFDLGAVSAATIAENRDSIRGSDLDRESQEQNFVDAVCRRSKLNRRLSKPLGIVQWQRRMALVRACLRSVQTPLTIRTTTTRAADGRTWQQAEKYPMMKTLTILLVATNLSHPRETNPALSIAHPPR